MLEFFEIARGCPYFGFETTVDMTCEEGLCSWIRQPANTVTSIAFLISTYFIFLKARADNSEYLKTIGILSGLIGFASLTAHATHLKLFGFADFSFQYLFIAALFWINLRRLNICIPLSIWTFSLSVWSLLAIVQWNFPQTTFFIYGLLFIGLLLSELNAYLKTKKGQYWDYFKCATLLGLGGVAFLLDYKRIICDPHNHYFQMHSVWHILAAWSLIYLARHYRQYV